MNRTVSRELEARVSVSVAKAMCNNNAQSVSIGVDVVEVARLERALLGGESSFISSFFAESEIRYATGKLRPAVPFAGIFAAKEAVYKALQLPWNRAFSWKWIELTHNEIGVPVVAFSESFVTAWPEHRCRSVSVSITHSADIAVAVAVASLDSPPAMT